MCAITVMKMHHVRTIDVSVSKDMQEVDSYAPKTLVCKLNILYNMLIILFFIAPIFAHKTEVATTATLSMRLRF